MTTDADVPRRLRRARTPLTPRERRIVAWVSAAPIIVAAVILTPLAMFGSLAWNEVVWGSLVYGGLLALAGGFVTVDRLQSRRCPRCGSVAVSTVTVCPDCAYDQATAPRWACEERHEVYLDPGVCACGRRLEPMPPIRGMAAEVRWSLKIGAWLLAFLMIMGVILSQVSG